MLCCDLLREEGALLGEGSLGHARDERDERRRVGRDSQRVVADPRPDRHAEKSGQEDQDRAAEYEVEVETYREWAGDCPRATVDVRFDQSYTNPTELSSSLLDLFGEPLRPLLCASEGIKPGMAALFVA